MMRITALILTRGGLRVEFVLNTQRLAIRPFSKAFLADYYQEFTDEITKYQYPDSFPHIEAADRVMSGFVRDMKQGEMLELVILTQGGEFLGSMEVFGLKEDTPEVGLWLKRSAHGAGYGREALRGLLDHLNQTGKYRYYIYEADVRNTPSIRLIEKFLVEKGGCEDITTDSGKHLTLQTYRILR